MRRAVRAFLAVLAAGLEKWAAQLSEDAKRYPLQQYYRGYEDGVRDGLAGAEHAKTWLQAKRPPTVWGEHS